MMNSCHYSQHPMGERITKAGTIMNSCHGSQHPMGERVVPWKEQRWNRGGLGHNSEVATFGWWLKYSKDGISLGVVKFLGRTRGRGMLMETEWLTEAVEK